MKVARICVEILRPARQVSSPLDTVHSLLARVCELISSLQQIASLCVGPNALSFVSLCPVLVCLGRSTNSVRADTRSLSLASEGKQNRTNECNRSPKNSTKHNLLSFKLLYNHCASLASGRREPDGLVHGDRTEERQSSGDGNATRSASGRSSTNGECDECDGREAK